MLHNLACILYFLIKSLYKLYIVDFVYFSHYPHPQNKIWSVPESIAFVKGCLVTLVMNKTECLSTWRGESSFLLLFIWLQWTVIATSLLVASMYSRSFYLWHLRRCLQTGGVAIGLWAGLAGPNSQFLNETHEFSELVLAGMALLMDQSHSVLPLRSAKAREYGELWWEKCTRATWTFPFKLARTSSFGRPELTNGKHVSYQYDIVTTSFAIWDYFIKWSSTVVSFVNYSLIIKYDHSKCLMTRESVLCQ